MLGLSTLLQIALLTALPAASTAGTPPLSCGDSGATGSKLCFPPGFLFGTATSAQQVEGGYNATGRTPSKWDGLCRSGAFGGTLECSNVADDFISRYKSDLSLMQGDGYNAFRFSISWSRAMKWDKTSQKMVKNPPGIAFYHSLVDEVVARGLEPVLTIFHWDLPIELNELGDFTNSSIVDHFVDYADLIYSEFGQKVKYWATINEPLSYAYLYILDNDPTNEFVVGHNLLLAHGAAVKRFRERRSQGSIRHDAVVSIVMSGFGAPLDAKNPKDVSAADRFVQYTLGWWYGPLTTGEYPAVMRARSGDRLPKFTAAQVALVKGSYDVHMFNFYFANPVTDCDSPTSKVDCSKQLPGWTTDMGVDSAQIPNLPGQRTGTGRCADHFGYPPNYLSAIEWVHAQDPHAKILLAENGWCGNETIHNDDQTWYFRTHIQQVHKAINEKNIPIVGYLAWSFMDNYEWGSYENRYGLYHVDYPANIGSKDVYDVPASKLSRTPRDAAKLVSGVAKTGCVAVLDEDKQFF